MSYFGIDVSKAELVVAEHGVAGTKPFANDRRGIRHLIKRLLRRAPQAVVLEASGGYESGVLNAMVEAGIPASRVNARQTKALQQALGRRAKTDALDASGLAHFAAVMPLRPFVPPSPVVAELRELARQRDELVALRSAQKCRVQQQRGLVRNSTARLIELLTRECRRLEKLLTEHLDRDPQLRERAQLLQSIGGFRSVNAAGLLSALPELGSLKRTEVASLVGVAPMSRDSGSLSLKRRISAGRASARRPLYLAALALVRKGKPLSAFYARLRTAGKPAKVALTACMRKLVVILNAMLRDRRPWVNQPLVG